MKIKAYKRFLRAYRDLPPGIRQKADKQITMLAANMNHPSLRTKRIKGRENIWEARVDVHYRMTFEIITDTIFLRVIGNHDDVLRSP